MRLSFIVPLFMMIPLLHAKYPTRRWVHVCKSGNITKYIYNKTKYMHNKTNYITQILRINGFDILYE